MCVHYFLKAGTEYPTPDSWYPQLKGREMHFGSCFRSTLVLAELLQGRKWHGRGVWLRKAAHPKAVRKWVRGEQPETRTQLSRSPLSPMIISSQVSPPNSIFGDEPIDGWVYWWYSTPTIQAHFQNPASEHETFRFNCCIVFMHPFFNQDSQWGVIFGQAFKSLCALLWEGGAALCAKPILHVYSVKYTSVICALLRLFLDYFDWNFGHFCKLLKGWFVNIDR